MFMTLVGCSLPVVMFRFHPGDLPPRVAQIKTKQAAIDDANPNAHTGGANK
jgi:hypothetical protein